MLSLEVNRKRSMTQWLRLNWTFFCSSQDACNGLNSMLQNSERRELYTIYIREEDHAIKPSFTSSACIASAPPETQIILDSRAYSTSRRLGPVNFGGPVVG